MTGHVRDPGRDDGDTPPVVSVLVPVRDDPDGIRELIGRLEAQTLPRGRFEIVIGDDGSRAGSLDDVVRNGGVRVEHGRPRTSYAARNRAARVALGGVLAFCDSDCLPEPTWLEEGLAALEQADLVAGEVTFVPPARPTVWSLLTIDMFLDQERNALLSRAVTANLFVTKAVFAAAGVFDESLPSGGDYDFARRCVEQGARLVYAPASVVRHPTLDSRPVFLRKVWTTNRWSAVRRVRDGGRPSFSNLLTFVPFLGVALARRNALRPVAGLQRHRLVAAGLRPSWRDSARALPVLYLLVAYVAVFGRVLGWLEGRRRVTGEPVFGYPTALAAPLEAPVRTLA